MNHPTRKKWGQNFLSDPNICRKIIAILDIKDGDNVLEIGPGLGALTIELAKKNINLTAVEIDPLCCDALEKLKLNHLKIINMDFLNFNLNQLNQPLKIIGNLPYYITSPILFKVFENRNWDQAVFMAQKEVVDRMVAIPSTKIYGRLTIMTSLNSVVKKEFSVPAHLFKPKPMVESAVFSLIPKIIDDVINTDFESFEKMIFKAFSHRRKVLRNSLQKYLIDETFEKYGSLRPEDLSLECYINIFTYWKMKLK